MVTRTRAVRLELVPALFSATTCTCTRTPSSACRSRFIRGKSVEIARGAVDGGCIWRHFDHRRNLERSPSDFPVTLTRNWYPVIGEPPSKRGALNRIRKSDFAGFDLARC